VIATPSGELTVNVEVVSTDAKIERGLMYREHLPPNDGMLFLLPIEKDWSFWMHNTLIPLDMFFIDSDWKVVGVVENATPLTDDPRQVPKMSQYVLETKAGFAKRHGFGAETQVRFTPPAQPNGETAP